MRWNDAGGARLRKQIDRRRRLERWINAGGAVLRVLLLFLVLFVVAYLFGLAVRVGAGRTVSTAALQELLQLIDELPAAISRGQLDAVELITEIFAARDAVRSTLLAPLEKIEETASALPFLDASGLPRGPALHLGLAIVATAEGLGVQPDRMAEVADEAFRRAGPAMRRAILRLCRGGARARLQPNGGPMP